MTRFEKCWGIHRGKGVGRNSLSQTFSRVDTPTFLKPKSFYSYLPMKMQQAECSETSAYKIQAPGNYPEESIQQNIYLIN